MSLNTVIKNDLANVLNDWDEIEVVGGEKTIKGMYDSTYLGQDIFGQTVETESPRLLITKTDFIDQHIAHGSIIKLPNGETYKVNAIHVGSDELVELVLGEN